MAIIINISPFERIIIIYNYLELNNFQLITNHILWYKVDTSMKNNTKTG